MLATHALSRDDLRTLVTSQGQAATLERLRSAEFSKHKLLLSAVMRMSADALSGSHARMLSDAYQLLADVETVHGEVVRDLIASPQFGAWASDCVHRLRAEEPGRPGSSRLGGTPLSTDLGQLAAVAVAAAFQTGHSFELEVPLRNGRVTFPALGTARPGGRLPWDWAWASQDRRGRRVHSSVSTVRIPVAGEQPTAAQSGWSAVPRLSAEVGGLRLAVTLDSHDPFLDRYDAARTTITRNHSVRWQRLLADAWAVLVRGDRQLAEMIAATVRTLVPVTAPSPTRHASSTETSSFGAVAMSLPADALSMAEALVHESHHAILGAVTDVVPMFSDVPDSLTYAPWREDPRPFGALLQGIYTHYGITRFWRHQRRNGSHTQRFRGHVEFGRWRGLTAQTASLLARSAALTESGSHFLSAIRRKLAEWQDESVPAEAADHAADLSLDHRVRWRLRHLVPDQAAVDSLAAAWRRGAPPPVRPAVVAARLEPGPLPGRTDNAREYLLILGHREPGSLGAASANSWADPADVALAAGDFALATGKYRARIERADDRDAWAGLAVAWRHTGPPNVARLLAERPEVVAALHRGLQGSGQVTADAVVRWLAGEP
jgi:HEXXH motif-containing protein